MNPQREISLYRRRPWGRVIAVAATAAVAVTVTVVALMLPGWIRYTDNGVPRVVGEDGLAPIIAAQDRFHAAHDRFASSAEELEADEEARYRWRADLMVRVEANRDGSAYIAGALGFSGDYAAVFHDGTAVHTGTGPTFEDALADTGWTPDWAGTAGFEQLAATSHMYGAIAVDGDRIVMVRMDPDGFTYTAAVRQVPTTGSGATWQDAVEDAGADPAGFTVTREVSSVPMTVTGEDGDTLTIAAGARGVEVRVDWAETVSAPAADPTVAAAELGLGDVLHDVNESFRCATASSPNTIHQATFCEDVQGRQLAWATTGRAVADGSPAGFERIGAGPRWQRTHDVVLPELDDLL